MITFLKILSSLLVWFLPIGIFIRDWKFKDGRTKLHKKINILLIIIGLIGAMLTTYFIMVEDTESKENSSMLINLQNSNDSLLTQNELMKIAIDSMNNKYDKLNNSNIILIGQNEESLTKNISLISKVDKYQSEIEKQKSIIDALKNYSWNASLGLLGNPPGSGPSSAIHFESELSDLIEKTCTINGDHVSFKSDPQSEKIYRQIVEKYPKFPFGYYYLAFALSENNDPTWKTYAQKAIEILEKTTSIDGHNPDHDKILKMLKETLKLN